MLNSICGIGKEDPTKYSKSFLSYAYHNGFIAAPIYSFEFAPALTQQAASNAMTAMKKATGHLEEDSIIVKKEAYKYETELYSTFIMGGYEEVYMKSALTWFDTSACQSCWNLTASSLYFHIVGAQSETSLVLIGESFNV